MNLLLNRLMEWVMKVIKRKMEKLLQQVMLLNYMHYKQSLDFNHLLLVLLQEITVKRSLPLNLN